MTPRRRRVLDVGEGDRERLRRYGAARLDREEHRGRHAGRERHRAAVDGHRRDRDLRDGVPAGAGDLVPAGMVTTRLLAQRIPDGEAATWH